MLTAINKAGEVYASDAIKGDSFWCKQCKQPVILKQGIVRIPHFAHYSNVSPCTWWEPESDRHRMMKNEILDILTDANKIKSAHIEHEIYGEDWFADEVEPRYFRLFPDVFIELTSGEKIAVECQISNKPLEEFIQKTARYSRLGMYTLWIFDSDGDDLIEDGNEIRVNEIQLQSHRWNYGRIYVLSLRGILHAVHFTSVSRENEWLGYTYYLKRTKEIDVKELSLHECGVFGINNDGVLVCRFLDKRWW